jgi:hypothetical protein
MDIAEIIAERKIQEAIQNGEFDHLPGEGKPLPPDGLDGIPEELRVSVKILRNAGYIPEDAELRKEIYNIKKLISLCENQPDKDGLIKKLTAKELKLTMILEKRKSVIPPEYKEKLF